MGNTFNGSGDSLYLSNGGTTVFVEVLMLAVSELATEPWDFRFAALLALQDQNAMGRGAVGFDLTDVDWGPTPELRTRNRDFTLRVTELALTRHRWNELDYDPPHAETYLRTFHTMLKTHPLTPPTNTGPALFPPPEEAASASCTRHRVLNALPHWEGCVFCTGG